MATSHRIISASETAARVSPVGTHSGVDITIQNLSITENIYVGGEGVTTINFGYRIPPNGAFSIELPGNCSLYVIAEAAADVAILETGLEIGD